MWPFKKEKYQVYFESDNWAVRKYSPVSPAREFLPEKFKNLPPFVRKEKHLIDSIKTVKSCPGISDYMGLGYVIPAWCDIELFPTEDGKIQARYSDISYNHAYHHIEQLGNFTDEKFKVRYPVKLDNPWWTYTEPGWSLLYLPMLYHEGRNWEAVPGIIDHDLGALKSPINIMLKEPKYTLIKQGEPIVQVVPIYRQEVTARVQDISDAARRRYLSIIKMWGMSFKGWAKYMKEKKFYKVDVKDTELPK